MVRFPPSLTIACPLWSLVRSLGPPRDLRRGKTKLRGLIRGCSSGGRPEYAPFSGRVRRALATRSFLKTRGVSSSGTESSPNGTCLGGGIGSKMRARETYCNLSSVREDQSRYTPVSLHRVKDSLGRELQQAVVSSWCYLLIARSCMHVFWV